MGVRDILDGLTFERVGNEADEVDGMTCLEGLADLAYRLKAPDAWPLAGARVDHHHRPLGLVDRRALWVARPAPGHSSPVAAGCLPSG